MQWCTEMGANMRLSTEQTATVFKSHDCIIQSVASDKICKEKVSEKDGSLVGLVRSEEIYFSLEYIRGKMYWLDKQKFDIH